MESNWGTKEEPKMRLSIYQTDLQYGEQRTNVQHVGKKRLLHLRKPKGFCGMYLAELFGLFEIIFYKFKSEWLMLKKEFGDMITDDLSEFVSSDKSIALQMVSGREGISLKEAHYLVFMNIDFSAVTYFQARDRMTTNVRTFNKIFWIFAEGGIEEQIYKVIKKKKNFTLRLFKNVLSL